MICKCCDQSIQPGETYTAQIEHGGSCAQPTVYLHDSCPPPPTRTMLRSRLSEQLRRAPLRPH
ncbi:hypothetical protein [Streptomyces sp. NPDC058280]|uniref:hypothetical protein n=1 Tax=Streptomyces sp. NPDC058280 TaxID=3346419 RepID=UPI0036E3AABC